MVLVKPLNKSISPLDLTLVLELRVVAFKRLSPDVSQRDRGHLNSQTSGQRGRNEWTLASSLVSFLRPGASQARSAVKQ